LNLAARYRSESRTDSVVATMYDRTKHNEKTGLTIRLLTSGGEQKADNHADRVLTDAIRKRMRVRVMAPAVFFFFQYGRRRAVPAPPQPVFKLGCSPVKRQSTSGIAGTSARGASSSRTLRVLHQLNPRPRHGQKSKD
jgi:hypothetical protein